MPRGEEGDVYSSVYLDAETKKKLIAIAEKTGKSRSQVIRELILQAGSDDRARMRELLEEMFVLLNST